MGWDSAPFFEEKVQAVLDDLVLKMKWCVRLLWWHASLLALYQASLWFVLTIHLDLIFREIMIIDFQSQCSHFFSQLLSVDCLLLKGEWWLFLQLTAFRFFVTAVLHIKLNINLWLAAVPLDSILFMNLMNMTCFGLALLWSVSADFQHRMVFISSVGFQLFNSFFDCLEPCV